MFYAKLALFENIATLDTLSQSVGYNGSKHDKLVIATRAFG